MVCHCSESLSSDLYEGHLSNTQIAWKVIECQFRIKIISINSLINFKIFSLKIFAFMMIFIFTLFLLFFGQADEYNDLLHLKVLQSHCRIFRSLHSLFHEQFYILLIFFLFKNPRQPLQFCVFLHLESLFILNYSKSKSAIF